MKVEKPCNHDQESHEELHAWPTLHRIGFDRVSDM